MYEGHGLYQERVISVLWEALCKRINKVDRTALVRSTPPTSAPPHRPQLNTLLVLFWPRGSCAQTQTQ